MIFWSSQQKWRTGSDIRNLAINNAKIYERVFDFIPKNYLTEVDNGDGYEDNKNSKIAPIWPVLNARTSDVKVASEYMSFSASFWNKYKSDEEFKKNIC